MRLGSWFSFSSQILILSKLLSIQLTLFSTFSTACSTVRAIAASSSLWADWKSLN